MVTKAISVTVSTAVGEGVAGDGAGPPVEKISWMMIGVFTKTSCASASPPLSSRKRTPVRANASEMTSRRHPRQKPINPKAMIAIKKHCWDVSNNAIELLPPFPGTPQYYKNAPQGQTKLACCSLKPLLH